MEQVAKVAELFAHPVRAAIIEALFDGRAASAGALARRAQASPSATSAHLRRLERDGAVLCEPNGRLRLYRLGGPEVAEAFEALARLGSPAPAVGLGAVTERDRLRQARTCYDHLAGVLGVEMTKAFVALGWLSRQQRGFEVRHQNAWAAFGIDIPTLRRERRPLARSCIDWTERQPHVAGALGREVLSQLLEQEWVARRENTRALVLTPHGRTQLAAELLLILD